MSWSVGVLVLETYDFISPVFHHSRIFEVRMFELAKIPFPEVARLAQSGKALIIVPVGVVEEHGAHLPLGVDSFTAEIYAAVTAPYLEEAGYEVVVAPTIHYGVARAAIDFPGTLSLEPETLRSMVVEIGRSLLRHKLNRVVILNGHRDKYHMKALDDAKNMLLQENGAQVLLLGFAHDDEVTAACYRDGVKQFYKSPRPEREGHGGESETSVALHSFPHLVNREALKNLDPNFDYDVDAFRNETKDYGSISAGRGYFGWPQAATVETGKQLVSTRGRNIANVILTAWGPPAP